MIAEILRYHTTSFDSRKTLVTRKYRFLKTYFSYVTRLGNSLYQITNLKYVVIVPASHHETHIYTSMSLSE